MALFTSSSLRMIMFPFTLSVASVSVMRAASPSLGYGAPYGAAAAYAVIPVHAAVVVCIAVVADAVLVLIEEAGSVRAAVVTCAAVVARLLFSC